MKLIFLATIFGVLLSFSAFANCLIGFENEVTEWQPIHKIFNYVVANKKELAKKGYKLINLNEDTPEWSDWIGSIHTKKIRGSQYLVMILYDFNKETQMKFKTRLYSYKSGVRNLFKKLPSCHSI